MKASKFILPVFILLLIACNNTKKKLEVVDLTLEETVIDTPPPPPPPPNDTQLIKYFKEYVEIKSDSAIVVEAPKTKPSNAHIFKDQAFLIINIGHENYIITFQNKTLPTNNLTNLETFLQRNKSKINNDKVFVAGFTNNDKQKQFVKLLAKYGISKFRVNAN